MHRCSSGFFLALILALTFLTALTGCLGKSSANQQHGGVESVTLNPVGPTSMEVGASQVFSPTAKNAGGGTVLSNDIQFIVSSGNPNLPAPLSVASNGNACAGTWDVNVAICSPGTPGIAYVQAVVNGISSPLTTVYVHQHVDSIHITNAQQVPPTYDCFSQGQTWQYTATALSNNVDITSTVGPLNWSAANAAVVTATPVTTGTSPNFVYQVQTTAKAPGITQLFASVSGTTSDPLPFTTCLIKAIYLQIKGQNNAGNSITVNSGSSVTVTATAVDTLYGKANSAPLANPPLTWSTSTPEVAAFSTTTTTTGTNNAIARSNLGSAALTASCAPPSCNIGVFPSVPIYATDCNVSPLSTPPAPTAAACVLPTSTKGYAAISVNVTTTATTLPTYTAWAATTGCQNNSGCSSALFSVTPGTTPIGSILSLSRTPNSLMFNHLSSSRLYIGSEQGLMYVDVSGSSPSVAAVSSSSTPCKISLCGKVLTISNDGSMVVISDDGSISGTSQVYIYSASGSSGSAGLDLIIPGETATAAAFSPDQLKLFIVTNAGHLYVYSAVDAVTQVGLPDVATDVKFSLDGSFAYIAGTPGATSIAGYATCDTPTTRVLSGITTTYPTLPPQPTNPPYALFPLPDQELDNVGNWAENVLVLDPPNVDTFGITVDQNPLLDGQTACTPPTVAPDANPKTSVDLAQGNFTPVYAQLASGGNQFIVVAQKIPAVIIFDVANGTTTSVPLSRSGYGSADPLAASGSPDGSTLFVASCDQYDQLNPPPAPPTCAVASIHIVNPFGQGDIQQVPYVNSGNNNNPNMCNNGGNPVPQCFPDLIAIKPQ